MLLKALIREQNRHFNSGFPKWAGGMTPLTISSEARLIAGWTERKRRGS
jgi:hypothetical protein